MTRLVALVTLELVLGATTAAQEPTRRIQLEKHNPPLKSPATYSMRTERDPKTGREVEFDPKPTVTLIDGRTGRYALRWIGHDGRRKTIVFQRDDLIDVVVAADALPQPPDTLRYRYRVRVLPSSVLKLRRFVVQNFAPDVRLVPQSKLSRGTMTNRPRPFSLGQWRDFAALPGFRPDPTPGTDVVFELESGAPPGLVGCRVAGERRHMVGVGEEMPEALAAVLPSYNAWPHGYTIGPDDRLKTLSPTQRAQKLLEWLPEFGRQGWITAERRPYYEATARRGDLNALAAVVDADLRAGQITSEVRAVVLGLADRLRK
jgi:hypothetical protein